MQKGAPCAIGQKKSQVLPTLTGRKLHQSEIIGTKPKAFLPQKVSESHTFTGQAKSQEIEEMPPPHLQEQGQGASCLGSFFARQGQTQNHGKRKECGPQNSLGVHHTVDSVSHRHCPPKAQMGFAVAQPRFSMLLASSVLSLQQTPAHLCPGR